MTKHGIFFCALALASAPAFAGGNYGEKAKSAGAGTTGMQEQQQEHQSMGGGQAGAMGEEAIVNLPQFSELDTDGNGSLSQEEYAQLQVLPSQGMGGGSAGGMDQQQEDQASGGGTTGDTMGGEDEVIDSSDLSEDEDQGTME